MPDYIRLHTGPTYFFTVVAHRRRPIFCDPALQTSLRQAIQFVRTTRPFAIDAWVILPDHMHCIWTLPDGDADYSTRWCAIKRFVSTGYGRALHDPRLLTRSRQAKCESTIWQRRFWEHAVRNRHDFERHMDYVHFNPVKHGYVKQVKEWRHSTFHRYVRDGVYPEDWAGTPDIREMSIE